MYIYPNLLTNVIVRLPHPPSGDNQGKKTFFPPSFDKRSEPA